MNKCPSLLKGNLGIPNSIKFFIGIMKLKNYIKPYSMIHGVINKTYILVIFTVRAEHELIHVLNLVKLS